MSRVTRNVDLEDARDLLERIPRACIADDLRIVRKYLLTPGGIRNTLAHLGQLRLRRKYHAQSVAKGRSCVIEVTPDGAELLGDGQRA
jgi:hypothetical protein